MAKITVGTAAQALDYGGTQRPIVQNLGPGKVEIDRDPDLTFGTGIRLEVGDAYEFVVGVGASTDPDPLYVIADTAGTDVRVMH